MSPTQAHITVALLRFAALSASAKGAAMERYLEECRSKHGQPHVWNPDVEIVESLSRVAAHTDSSGLRLEACAKVEAIAESLLDEQQSLVDRSAYAGNLGVRLQEAAQHALSYFSDVDDVGLSLWDLMCYTCD